MLHSCKIVVAAALTLVFAGLPSTVSATKFAGEFMSLGGGARGLGMGGAYCAVGGEASAVYWNPAAISGGQKRQALLMHSERFGDLVNYNFAAFTMPTTLFVSEERQASLGFALIHQGVTDIPITSHIKHIERNGVPGFQPEDGDELPTDGLRYESNNDFALLSTFAMNTDFGRIGGTLKVVYSDFVTGVTGTGIGVDLGFLRQNVLPRLDVGLKLQDITGTYLSWSTGRNEFITPSFRVGLAYRLTSTTLQGAVLLTTDSVFYFDDRRDAAQLWSSSVGADLKFGTEIVFQDKVMIRGGFDSANPTAGAGFRVGALGFDYAYLHHDDFESTHRVSGTVNF